MSDLHGLVRPDDVVVAADSMLRALEPHVDLDWRSPASGLDWDVRTTVAHAASAAAKYALSLAGGSSRYIAIRCAGTDDASNDDLLHAVVSAATPLREVANNVPVGRRGFYVSGMTDAEGFVAMGCTEILVHAYDAAQTFGARLDPEDGLCRRVISRLFP